MIQGNLVMRYKGGDAGLVGLSKEYSGDICVLASKMCLLYGPWLEDVGYHNECATRSMYLAIAMKRCYFHSLLINTSPPGERYLRLVSMRKTSIIHDIHSILFYENG